MGFLPDGSMLRATRTPRGSPRRAVRSRGFATPFHAGAPGSAARRPAPALFQLSRLRVLGIGLEDPGDLLLGLDAIALGLEHARQVDAGLVEVGMQLERLRERGERVVELSLLELDEPDQGMEVGVSRMLAQGLSG